MTKTTLRGMLLLLAFLLVLALIPGMVSEFNLNLITSMAIYSLFVLSYNILFGHAGLLSFGHAAYFGMGAYTTIILFKKLKVGLLTGLLAGAGSGALLGLIFGLFVVRLGGTYFALLTLAFNQLVYAAAEKFRFLTGGEDGVAAMRPKLVLPGLGAIDMFSSVNWYYLVVTVVCAGGAFCWYFTRTPLGRLNECLRENEDRARFIGYNVYASKLAVYVISAFFAGLAGALIGAFQEFVTVTFINLDKAAEVLIMTFIGGAHYFWGPILGACFLTWLNDVISSWTKHWPLIQGALFIALVMYAPNGLSGLVVGLKDRLIPKVAGRRAGA
ncbi:MAG: branched-chain amino acid ABC transporter permease [Desulfobacterales bacterium]|nr:branched-chain amino acid ABC transporter permease [Desulfobacterales bacterium]